SPAHGDTVRASFSEDLEFGGVVKRLVRTRLRQRAAIKVECQGWAFDASVRITRTVEADTLLLDLAYDLYTTYLAPRGWTWIGDTDGGPALPELTFEKLALYSVFDQLTKQSGYPW